MKVNNYMKILDILNETAGLRKYKVILVRHNDDGNERWDSEYSYTFDAKDWKDAAEIVRARIPSFAKKDLEVKKIYDVKNGRPVFLD